MSKEFVSKLRDIRDTKFYIGPMSKNVVDAVLEFTEETGNKIGFIPSRRQVEYNGGYVNKWTTESFDKYVNERVLIQRDHGGPGQGYKDDNGDKSYHCDAKYFDVIHIDPWKAFPNFNDGLQATKSAIEFINKINGEILFEVGTEESIRRFTPDEVDKLMEGLRGANGFHKIKFLVVQSGVGIDLGKQVNTGKYNEKRLSDFIDVCKKWNLYSKEHNGDYLSSREIWDKFGVGLHAINIAPEFGQIETQCYLDKMNKVDIEKFYDICYKSKRWEKWVDKSFKVKKTLKFKKELILICGHYVLSDKKFLTLKKKYKGIDEVVKTTIKEKLTELF